MLSLLLIKPEAVKRQITGPVIEELEKSFSILNLRKLIPTEKRIDRHYEEHIIQPWYPEVRSTMMDGPIVAMVLQHKLESYHTVDILRRLVGPYKNRIPGTLRHKYAVNDRLNAIHSSDSDASAMREIQVWFPYV